MFVAQTQEKLHARVYNLIHNMLARFKSHGPLLLSLPFKIHVIVKIPLEVTTFPYCVWNDNL